MKQKLNEDMSREQRLAQQKMWNDQHLSDKRKRLEKNQFFSNGSMHEDFGILKSKMVQLLQQLNNFTEAIDDIESAIEINIKDTGIRGHEFAHERLDEIKEKLGKMYSAVNSFDAPLNQLIDDMDTLTNPDDEVYKSREDREAEDNMMPPMNEAIEKIKSEFKRYL